jgi:hypothetical protein
MRLRPALGQAALDQAALGQAALGQAALDQAALGQAALSQAALDQAALGQAAFGQTLSSCGSVQGRPLRSCKGLDVAMHFNKGNQKRHDSVVFGLDVILKLES